MYSQDKISTTVTEGGYATVQCRMIVGFQQGQNLTWTWKLKDVELVASAGRVEIVTTNSTSELTLRKITLNDKGNITCTVDNGAGNFTEKVELRVKSKRIFMRFLFLLLDFYLILFYFNRYFSCIMAIFSNCC
jgi:hypothetical protein